MTGDALLGKPWIAGARGPDAYDCLGVVIALTGMVLPLEAGLREVVSTVRGHFDRVTDAIRSGDVLYWPRPGEKHIAYVETDRYVIESIEGVGVCRTQLSYVLEERSPPEIYRWKP